MLVLVGFAVVAGAATALSPCVLPVLPIALSAGATGGSRRPLGVVVGLTLSFSFATVALAYAISALGLPSGLTRTLAICVLIAAGVALLVPSLAARVEAFASRLVRRSPRLGDSDGFRSGVLIGVGLGFVYTPCAGPILAGVITVSASQSFTAARLLTAFAYAVGAGVALYVLMRAGRRLTARLRTRSIRIQQAFGAVMVVVAVLMLASVDTRFESAIASGLPSFLVDPTSRLEQSHAVRAALGGQSSHRIASASSASGSGSLPTLGQAPEFVGTQRWFNSSPLTLAGLSLQHRVVLIDFWTYSCINCIRTLPQLEAWDARYRRYGLTIVGVHTPEFPFERSASNVAAAVSQDGVRYPVVQDNDAATWSAWGNEYWPAEYLVDATGQVRHVSFGEGDYAKTEAAIRTLLAAAGASSLPPPTSVSVLPPPAQTATPETYLGAERADRFENGHITPGAHDYGGGAPSLAPDELAYRGRWTIGSQSAGAGPSARLYLRFRARRVYVVLGGSPGRTLHARVLFDGRPIASGSGGADVHGGQLSIAAQRLYSVVSLPSTQSHELEIDPEAGVQGYSFTFG